MRILVLALLLNGLRQTLRKFESVEHFLENQANHLPKEDFKKCHQDLLQVYTSNKQTNQICNKDGSYMLILLNPALEKNFDKLNQKNPGFARIVKYVKETIAGEQLIVMLMYSSFGFTQDKQVKYDTFKKVVSQSSELDILNATKNLLINYSEAYGNNHVFLTKEYQKMSEIHFYKFTMKGVKDKEASLIKKKSKELKEEAEQKKWTEEQLKAEAKKLVQEDLKNWIAKQPYNKPEINIADHAEVQEGKDQSPLVKKLVISILMIAAQRQEYYNLTFEEYKQLSLPLEKEYTFDELKKLFKPIEDFISLKEPKFVKSLGTSIISTFSSNVCSSYKWDDLLKVLTGSQKVSAAYLASCLENLHDVATHKEFVAPKLDNSRVPDINVPTSTLVKPVQTEVTSDSVQKIETNAGKASILRRN